MKVNLVATILDFDENPILEEDNQPLLLRKACVVSLSTPLDEDRGLSPEKVVERWNLAMRINSGGDGFELTPEAVTAIRARIPKCYTLVPAGRALQLLT